MATHSSILAWGIPWTEEPARLHIHEVAESVRHNLATKPVRVSGVVVACSLRHGGRESIIDMTDVVKKFDGSYAINNSTICFVFKGEAYVTPYTRAGVATLIDEGLIKNSFYVPFSNGSYPKGEKAKWERLRDAAHESYRCDCEADSLQWCDEHGIGSLSDADLKRCFKIPRGGVAVRSRGHESVVYPIADEIHVGRNVLGYYGTNNGKTVFVYRDGHTYVTKGYWVIDKLKKAGYQRGSLFVPFSNGEQVVDPLLAAKWEVSK